jgi:hypothetical protein
LKPNPDPDIASELPCRTLPVTAVITGVASAIENAVMTAVAQNSASFEIGALVRYIADDGNKSSPRSLVHQLAARHGSAFHVAVRVVQDLDLICMQQSGTQGKEEKAKPAVYGAYHYVQLAGTAQLSPLRGNEVRYMPTWSGSFAAN